MSEQFAIQPEEFDSTNDRLDSILDRLNSLGKSGTEMKAAPRPLTSVPNVGGDVSDDTTGVSETPNLVPPALPPLGVVPDLDVIDEIDESADAEAFAALDTVDLGEDFESVTAIDNFILEDESILDDELAPHDLEAPEAGWAEIGNEADEVVLDGQLTDADIDMAEAADSEAIAAELVEVDDFEAALTYDTPVTLPVASTEVTSAQVTDTPAPEADVFEADVFEADVFELNSTDLDAPAAETDLFALAETDLFAPASAADVFVAEPDVAEITATELAATEVTDTEITAPDVPVSELEMEVPATEAMESQVFELDEPAAEAATPPELPEAPTSIFGSGLGRGSKKSEEEAPKQETDGWVSHHGPSDIEAPASETVAAPFATLTGDGDSEIADTSAYDAASDPQWDMDAAPVVGSIFDQDDADVVETSAVHVDPLEMANEVEQDLGDLGELGAADPFSELGEIHAPATTAEINSPVIDHVPTSFDALETATAPVEHSNMYSSDDELPLPDFTGVYDESGESSSAPTGIASLSVGDRELDKLRPEEDELESDDLLLADERQGGNWSPMLQLIFVIGFGVAVLVYFWLQDPAAVEDMRNELNALLGRN